MRRAFAFSCALFVACSGSTSGMDAGPVCPAQTGAGTSHTANITAAETWKAADGPHVLASGLTVRAALTIEPCSVVRLGPDKVLTIGADGSLIANGEADKPITFERSDASKAWSQIRAQSGGTLRFVHTRIVGGGAPQNAPLDGAAAVDVRGPDQTQPPGELLHVDHVTIQDSASQGVLLREAGGFSATSTDLTVKGSAHAPIHSWASAAGTIPSGTYTGNAVDEIILEGGGLGGISRDVTFKDRGVPYRVGDSIVAGRLDVAAGATGPVATLTLEANVKLKFKKDGAMYVQYAQNTSPARGALVAVGTMDKPVVLTSAQATPDAGDWLGLHFNGAVDPKTKLDHVRVEFAGGVTSSVGSSCKYPDNVNNAAAIRVFTEPQTAFITNTKVVASAWHGIDRGWLGTPNLSFLGGSNDLTGVTRCKETHPTPNASLCPMPVPCP